MSQSIRFLGFAILAWAAVRAVSLGLVPGTGALAFDIRSARPETQLPPIQPTIFPSIDPVRPAGQGSQAAMAYGPSVAYPPYGANPQFAPYPIYVPVAVDGRSSPPQIIYVNPPPGEPRDIRADSAALPAAAQQQQLSLATPIPTFQSTPSFATPNRPSGLDRLSLTGWATMRSKAGADGLASGGILGGSQAGTRIMWSVSPRLSASLRASAPVNSQRGAEAALGVRYQPFSRWPVALTLERRHAFRDYGQSAFALFAEGGVYGQSLPWQSILDGYFQAGIVDFNDPDWFLDGQLAATRPVWRNLSAGFGAWGGAQPGINRLDVGPRLSLRVGSRMRAHFDYRLNVAGNAQPGSGTVVTLAGDF
ncbi:MAG: hypothetical protein ACJ8FC_08210 [Sphingomicrobium sp.]